MGNSLAQKLEYNSKEFEEASSYNMNEMDWRHYDPALGRWLTPDPIIHFSTSPYSAFENNPVYWNDPSGLDVINETDRITFTGAEAVGFFNAYNSFLDTGYGEFEITENIYDFDIPGLTVDAYRSGGGYRLESSFAQKVENQVYKYSPVHEYLRSDMNSLSAWIGYAGLQISKTEALLKSVGTEQILKSAKNFGRAVGLGGAIMTGIEGYADGHMSGGDWVKVGIGVVTTFTPYGWVYGAIDASVGLATGTTITDRIGNYIDEK